MKKGGEEIVSDRDAVDQSVQALFRGIVETGRLIPEVGTNPQVMFILAVFSPVLAFAVSRGLYSIITPRAAKLAEGYARAFDNDTKRMNEQAEQAKDDPTYQDTMYRTFRAMVDAADPAVVDALGYLAGNYTSNKRKPDAFFRGLGRVLCDLEEKDFEQLRELLGGLQSFTVEDGFWFDVAIDSRIDETTKVMTDGGEEYDHMDAVVIADGNTYTDVGIFPGVGRLFSLLKREYLAENLSPVIDGQVLERTFPLGDSAMYISSKTVREILEIISQKP